MTSSNLPLRLRVATWNIRIGIETSMAAVANSFRAVFAGDDAIDLLALQEVAVDWRMGERMNQPAYLAAALDLPYHAFAGSLTDHRGGRFGVALLSRWPIAAVDTTLLPRDRDEQRSALRVTLSTQPALVVVNTHLSVDPDERLKQAHMVRQLVDASHPALLVGDFNDTPDSSTLAALRGPNVDHEPLVDAFDAAGRGDELTFSVKAPNRRIDYIMAQRGWARPRMCRVATEVTTSDHFPVVAEIERVDGRRSVV